MTNEPIDLISQEDPLEAEQLGEDAALSTFGTTSTASTGSCPVSSAGSVMTAS
ncbi:thiocillin family RiPP [Nocardioides zeae]